MATSTLTKARQNKADEFYTQLPDIEAEMRHYRDQFKGKSVLCNCDWIILLWALLDVVFLVMKNSEQTKRVRTTVAARSGAPRAMLRPRPGAFVVAP